MSRWMAFTLLLATGCASSARVEDAPARNGRAGATPDTSPAASTARAALAPFKAGLRQALGNALAESGPAGAIEVCATQAPALLRAAERPGIRLGRTSDRLRNPANTAPAWVAPWLETFRDQPGAQGRTVEIDADRVGYVEPIRVQPMCLSCHGKDLAPEVKAALDERYPTDRARGYSAGELRGLMWVEMDRQLVER